MRRRSDSAPRTLVCGNRTTKILGRLPDQIDLAEALAQPGEPQPLGSAILTRLGWALDQQNRKPALEMTETSDLLIDELARDPWSIDGRAGDEEELVLALQKGAAPNCRAAERLSARSRRSRCRAGSRQGFARRRQNKEPRLEAPPRRARILGKAVFSPCDRIPCRYGAAHNCIWGRPGCRHQPRRERTRIACLHSRSENDATVPRCFAKLSIIKTW